MRTDKSEFPHSRPVRLIIPPDLRQVASARRLMQEVGEAAGLSESRIFDLQVATSEAVANAVEHATSEAEILVWHLPDRLIVEVTNDGAFQPGVCSDDQYRRRGLGLPLMVSLADDVHVVREPEGRTRVSLTFLLDGAGHGGAPGEGASDELGAGPATILSRLRAETQKVEVASSEAALLANLLERASQPFGVKLPGGGLGFFNPAYCELLGYAKEEFAALNWAEDLTPPDWRNLERQKLADLVRSREPVRYEKEYLHKNGDRIPVELLVHVVCDAAGDPLYYYAFITDLSERKEAEEHRERLLAQEQYLSEELAAANEELQASVEELQVRTEELAAQDEELRAQADELRAGEERYRIVSDFTYDWESWRSPTGELLYVSPSCRRVTGYPREAFLDDPTLYLALVFPEDRERVRAHLAADEDCPGLQFRIRARTGEERWIEHACQKVEDGSGRSLGRRGSDRDITDRKLGEAELEQTRAALEVALSQAAGALEVTRQSLDERTRHLDAFFEHSLTPFVLLDSAYNFARVNEAFAQAWKSRAEEFPGRNYFELFPSDARVIFDEVLRTKQPFQVKARPFDDPAHPNHDVTYWDWTLTPLFDDAGEVEGLVFALEDVTGRVRPQGNRWLHGLSWQIGRLMIRRRRLALVLPVGLILQALLFLGLNQLESPRLYLGLPGPAAALIGVVTAVVAGPTAGAIVALGGGLAYMATLADFGDAVIWPVIVASILLWMAVSVVAGLAGEMVRRRAASRETLLIQSVVDRDALLDSVKKSEEKFRHASEENARLYEDQLKIAERLQQAFVHIPSEIGPLRLGHLYRSATEAARVGGDFYDIFDAKDGKIVVLIGDVAGHGIEAARIAGLTKDVIHAFAHQSLQPDEVLRNANSLLIEKLSGGFVTVFLGILDVKTGALDYASAGHPETLLRRGSGVIQALGEGSSPVGVFPEARWEVARAQLNPGDLLLLYTDGVIEARQNGDFFGQERLRSLLTRRGVGAEDLPQLVLDEILDFSAGDLQDDVALLALALAKDPG